MNININMKMRSLISLIFILVMVFACKNKHGVDAGGSVPKGTSEHDPLHCIAEYAATAEYSLSLATNRIVKGDEEFFVNVHEQNISFVKVKNENDYITYWVGGIVSGDTSCLDGELRVNIENEKIIKASFFPIRRGMTPLFVKIILIGEPD